MATLPIASFSTKSGLNTRPISFFDNSVSTDAPIDNWSWNFGDNTDTNYVKYSASIIHHFAKPGVYIVSLIVTDSLGCKDTIQEKIVVNTIGIFAAFTSDTVCQGNVTQFTDKSTIDFGTITAWSWDFGDNTPVSNNENPIHQYLNAGTYSVTLIVYGENTSDTVVNNVIVYAMPVADFTYKNTCSSQPTEFNNTSQIKLGNIVSFKWIFGNGDIQNLLILW